MQRLVGVDSTWKKCSDWKKLKQLLAYVLAKGIRKRIVVVGLCPEGPREAV